MRFKYIIVAAVFIALFVIFSGIASIQLKSIRINETTGSIKAQSTWFGFWTTEPTYEITPLELKLQEKGIAWNHDWNFLYRDYYNFWGKPICFDCNRAPPIYELIPDLGDFIEVASEKQLREFVEAMQSNNDNRKKTAIENAIRRASSHGVRKWETSNSN